MEWLYEKNEDNTARYVLGTVGNRPLVCIGNNPSTAEPDKLDPTLQSVERISKVNGFDSWIMINIYPQRSTNPAGIDMQRNDSICRENLNQIDRILKEYKPAIWAAWGTNLTKRPYLINCLHEIADLANNYDCKWVGYGIPLKNGHPHHPLFLKSECRSYDFEMKSYLRNIAIITVFSYMNIRELTEFRYSEFYDTLKYAGLLDYDYDRHLGESPISIDKSLKLLKSADLQFAKALLTAMLREDHFCNGSFDKRLEKKEVARVLRKLKGFYSDNHGNN